MKKNLCVRYTGKAGKVELVDIGYPKLEHPTTKRKLPHAVIIETVATNICGSDQHMVRGRTTAEAGQTLGHEITGIVREVGDAVEWLKVGDLVSIPFNIACGTCENCNNGLTGICLRVNSKRAGAAYGYVDMDGWIGGQANFVMVPWADFNCLHLGDKDTAMAHILSLALLSDIFPTGYHGAVTAGVSPGKSVYIAGAGPVGLASAEGAKLLGAGLIIVGDLNDDRLAQAKAAGFETVKIGSTPIVELVEQAFKVREVDCAVDCVGFEARANATTEAAATVLNDAMTIVRAGGNIGIPGLYVTGDPGSADVNAQTGNLMVRLGLGWAKSCCFATGQCPVKRYNRALMKAILAGRCNPGRTVNAQVIALEDAPKGYEVFDAGASVKYLLDPNGHLKNMRKKVAA